MSWIIWIIAAYLLGSIPVGLLMGLARGVDIRQSGSGNIGATNLGRTLGRRWGIACFVLDLGKGLAPVLAAGAAHGLLGRWMTDIPAADSWWWVAVGAAALLGHVFPVFLGFKGGKGVATAFGVLLGVCPTLTIAAAAGMATWLVVVAFTRLVSLASMVAACMVPAVTAIVLLLQPAPEDVSLAGRMSPPMTVTLLVALLIMVRHRSNIARLLRGGEHTVWRNDDSQ